jgi:hypothetical protein
MSPVFIDQDGRIFSMTKTPPYNPWPRRLILLASLLILGITVALLCGTETGPLQWLASSF